MKKVKGRTRGLLTEDMFGSRKGRKSQRRKIRRAIEAIMRERGQSGRRPGRVGEIEREAKGFLKKLSEPAMDDVCRIYFQNVRTLKIDGDPTQGPFGILRAAGVDIIGISEVNKNWDQPMIRRRYEKGIKESYGGAGIQVASNEDYKPRGMRKPGGIMMITSDEVQSKVKRRENDRLGRWAKVEVDWKELSLAVYTVYAPQMGDLGGPSTVRRQLQHSRDRENDMEEAMGSPGRQGLERSNVNDSLYEDLVGEIQRDKEQGREVIVGGDFNEENVGGTRMKKFMEGEGMVNLYEARMGEVPATRHPGKKTIDHVWASSEAVGRVDEMGIVPRDGVFISDHVGLFIDVKVGERNPRLVKPMREPRGLKSGNARSVKTYVDKVKAKVSGRKVERCLDKLEGVSVQQGEARGMEKSLNEVNEMIQRMLLGSERDLQRQPRALFTPEWQGLRAEKRYWAKLRKGMSGTTHHELEREWAGHEERNWGMTDRDMREKLREVDKRIEAYEKGQEGKRKEFLEELAELKGAEGEEEVAKAVKEINRRECQAREAWRIREATKGRRATELPEVQVPSGETEVDEMWEVIKGEGEDPKEWETVRGAEEVDAVMTPWCAKHFGQAEGTPFTTGRWPKELDIGEEKNVVEQIIAGETVTKETDGKVCSEWVAELKRKKEGTPEVELSAEYEDFLKFALISLIKAAEAVTSGQEEHKVGEGCMSWNLVTLVAQQFLR